MIKKRLNGNFIVFDDETGDALRVIAPHDDDYAEMLKLKDVKVYTDKYDITEITARLAEIDREAIRPMRAALAGTSTLFDTDKLAELEAEADKLREELRGVLG